MSIHSSNTASFRSEENGGVSILFGIMAIVLFAFIGGAIDYARLNHAHDRTVSALDSALLAGGRTLQTEVNANDKALAAAQTYYNEQIRARFDVDAPTIELKVAADGLSISGKATGSVKTPFMALVGVNSLPIVVESSAALAVGGNGSSTLEISLMLDVTGSMCDGNADPCQHGSKIDALKTSAKDLVDIVVRDNGKSNSRVALVPFSTRVRVASQQTGDIKDRMKKLTGLDSKWSGWYNQCKESTANSSGGSEVSNNWSCQRYESEMVNNWKVFPCVTDRTGPQQFSDAAPGSNTWLNAHDGGRFPLSRDSSDTPIADGDHLGKHKTDPAFHWTYGEDHEDFCAEVPTENVIVPLSGDNHQLKDHIDGLTAIGSTAGALGTAWSWYMLSPNFANVWPSESRPGPYSDLTAKNPNDSPKLRKIAVIMTDGLYNTYRNWKDQDPVAVSDNAKSICTNMKAAGIEIYTVGFDLDALSSGDRARAEDVLKTCGSDISHFYEAIDPEKLRQSFRDIALKLSELYIQK